MDAEWRLLLAPDQSAGAVDRLLLAHVLKGLVVEYLDLADGLEADDAPLLEVAQSARHRLEGVQCAQVMPAIHVVVPLPP